LRDFASAWFVRDAPALVSRLITLISAGEISADPAEFLIFQK